MLSKVYKDILDNSISGDKIYGGSINYVDSIYSTELYVPQDTTSPVLAAAAGRIDGAGIKIGFYQAIDSVRARTINVNHTSTALFTGTFDSDSGPRFGLGIQTGVTLFYLKGSYSGPDIFHFRPVDPFSYITQKMIIGGSAQVKGSSYKLEVNGSLYTSGVINCVGALAAASIASDSFDLDTVGGLVNLNIAAIAALDGDLSTHVANLSNPHQVTSAQISLGNVTNFSQMKKISSSTDDNVPQWDGTTGDLLKDGYPVETTLAGAVTKLARADAIKTYSDAIQTNLTNHVNASNAHVLEFTEEANGTTLAALAGTADINGDPDTPTWNTAASGRVHVAQLGGGANKVVMLSFDYLATLSGIVNYLTFDLSSFFAGSSLRLDCPCVVHLEQGTPQPHEEVGMVKMNANGIILIRRPEPSGAYQLLPAQSIRVTFNAVVPIWY